MADTSRPAATFSPRYCSKHRHAACRFRRILGPLRDGVHFTMVADCCHSGTILDGAEVGPRRPCSASCLVVVAASTSRFQRRPSLPHDREETLRGRNFICGCLSFLPGTVDHRRSPSTATRTPSETYLRMCLARSGCEISTRESLRAATWRLQTSAMNYLRRCLARGCAVRRRDGRLRSTAVLCSAASSTMMI